jgi:hypothetical protein
LNFLAKLDGVTATGLSPSEWSLWAAATIDQPGEVGLTLTNTPDGLLAVRVTHRIHDSIRVSNYKQIDGKWEFSLIDAVNSQVPAAK